MCTNLVLLRRRNLPVQQCELQLTVPVSSPVTQKDDKADDLL